MNTPKDGEGNMDSRSDLSGLLGRVEESTGPDRELDGALAVAIDGYWTMPGRYGDDTLDYCYEREGVTVQPGHGGFQLVRPYTASLDYTLALCERVLPGWLRGLDERQYESGPSFWLADLVPPGGTEDFGGRAKTPALALLAAMLKALIAQGEAGTAEPLSRSGRK